MAQNDTKSSTKKGLAKSLTGRTRLIVAVGVVLVLAIGYFAWQRYDNHPIVDSQIVKEAGFTVYEPTSLPSGYRIDSQTTSLKNNVLSYMIDGESDKEDITITVQRRPANFDMDKISKGGSLGSTTTSSGALYNLSTSSNTQFLLDAGDSLVYITSTSKVSTAEINRLVSSFRKVN